MFPDQMALNAKTFQIFAGPITASSPAPLMRKMHRRPTASLEDQPDPAAFARLVSLFVDPKTYGVLLFAGHFDTPRMMR